MTRDLLGNRILKHYTLFEKTFFEKYYLFNDKIYQVLRLKRYVGKEGLSYNLQVIDINNKRRKVIRVIDMKDTEFENKKLFHTIKKLKDFYNISTKKQYDFSYFENTKENINLIVEPLYKLGYENYSRTTHTSYHNTKYTIVKNGLLLTSDDIGEENLRQIFKVY